MISGPSGAGKGAICAGLAERTSAMLSVSMTTRAPRAGETEGKSYFFVDKERFREAIDGGELFEYAEVYGEYYGTPKAPVHAYLDKGKDVILEIEVMGAMQAREQLEEAKLIFIMPPSLEELRRRIEARGTETSEKIADRLERAAMEIEYIEKYDYLVINDKLDKAVTDVLYIMHAERLYNNAPTMLFLSLSNATIMRRAGTMRIGEATRNIIEGFKQKL